MGAASSASSVSSARGAGGQRRPVAVDPALRLGRLEVVERAAVDQRLDRHVADDLAAAQDPHLAAVGDDADLAPSRSATSRRPPAPRRPAPARPPPASAPGTRRP